MDDDNDQYLDQDEIDCLTDPFDSASTPDDFDKDLIPDCIDPNDDNDSCPDTEDEFPLDPEFCQDTDGDGIDDRFDFDSDNDGILITEINSHRILMPVQMVMVTGHLIVRIQIKIMTDFR